MKSFKAISNHLINIIQNINLIKDKDFCMANSETRDQTVYSHLEDGSVIEPIRIMKIN